MAVAGIEPETFKPFFPRVLLTWLYDAPRATHRAVDGTIAFVDVSGFTKLSERLSRRGKLGAEELTDTIGSLFERLLGVAYANGGGLVKFGGDALLLLFSERDHQVRAARAAAGMRAALRDVGALDVGGTRVSLRMSVGINSGTFHFFLVGDSHRELIVSGPAATGTVEMESAAEAGEILLSPATAAALPRATVGAAKGPGFLLRGAPPGLAAAASELTATPPTGEMLRCVPVALREHVASGRLEAEHRPVTIAFLKFTGVDALIASGGAAAAARELDALVRDVQRATDRRGVCFLATDIDRDGGKIILTAGAPAVSEDDDERVLLAAREIADGSRVLTVRIGVNAGHVFAGDVGPSYRRTYTVMGDAVNLAARLMASAEPGEVRATAPVLERSRTTFATTPLEPFFVKGKAKPVEASALGARAGSRAGSVSARRIVGRDRERAVLEAALADARAGRGRLVELVGEPGLGKTTLIEGLRARAAGDAVVAVACEQYESSTAYFTFRSVLRALLGVPDGADGSAAALRLREVVAAIEPDLLPRLALFAPVLDAQIDETPESAQIEERFRHPRLADAAGRLMERLVRAATLFVLEDAHWMDESSADLLARALSSVAGRPWLVCATRRDQEGGFRAGEGATVIRLEPLDARDAAELLDAAGGSPLRPDEIAALVERSGGNPLFLRELSAAARAGGMASLPGSIEAMLMARIDRLEPDERAMLRNASVLGRTFPRTLLGAVLDPVPPDGSPIWEHLTGLLEPGTDGTVSFGHALIRDAAYEGLAFRSRRALHARVGETIRATGGDEEVERLSFHFFHAQRFAEAWRYSIAAARDARAIYANAEAAEFYDRALHAGRRLGTIPSGEMAAAYEGLGEVRERVGALREADGAYGAARALLADPVEDARLMVKQALLHGWMERHAHALRWITRALRRLDGVAAREAAVQRARALAWYAYVRQEQGKHRDATSWARRAIEEASAVDDLDTLAHAHKVLGWADLDLGLLDDDRNLRAALDYYERLRELSGQAKVLNNMGVAAYWRGEWTRAIALYERALEIHRRRGDAMMQAYPLSNVGEILADQGRLDEAGPMFREASAIWRSAGYLSGVAFGAMNLGRLAARAGRYDEARALFETARAGSLATGATADLIDTDTRDAECRLLAGDLTGALGQANVTLARAQALGGVAAQSPVLYRVQGLALAMMERPRDAVAALEQSLIAARSRRAGFEVALTLRAMMPLASAADRPAMRAESATILWRLGVVRVNDLPRSLRPASSY